MAENLRVKWSDEAMAELDYFYLYLVLNFGKKEAEEFLDQIEEFEIVISRYPESFISSEIKSNLRIGFVNKIVSCVYEIGVSEVFIVSLIDNRSKKNPR